MNEAHDVPPGGQPKLRRSGPPYQMRWIAVMTLPSLVAILILGLSLQERWAVVAKAGLVQPVAAALIALTVVLSMRLTWGRYSNDRRKGTISASSASIAVKLWALCFALLFGSMLFSSAVSKWSGAFTESGESLPKITETELELSTSQPARAVAKARTTK